MHAVKDLPDDAALAAMLALVNSNERPLSYAQSVQRNHAVDRLNRLAPVLAAALLEAHGRERDAAMVKILP